MTFKKTLALLLFIATIFSCKKKEAQNEWTNLIDNDLSKWEVFLGIPHKSSGIKGYENQENVKEGKPLGIGNRRNVFSVKEENGEKILHITGEIFGSLNSKEVYENYHLKFMAKWGDKKWEPRLNSPMNNGVLYHSIGEYGKGLWNTWMSSLEFEVEQSNFGDFITINDKYVKAKCRAKKSSDGFYYFDPESPLVDFCWTGQESGRCYAKDFEKPKGEWNSMELLCFGDKAIHIVNGKIVMIVEQPHFFNGKDWTPMNKGKLQIQSEAAEIFYKEIKIKPLLKGDFDKIISYSQK